MRRSTKPRWVGKKTGPNPTDRAKSGTKRHHLTDGAGLPIAVALTAANRPDKEAIATLLDARVVRAPAAVEQHLCLDKGYDYADAERAVRLLATSRIFGAVAKNAGHVAAGAGRAGGWSNG